MISFFLIGYPGGLHVCVILRYDAKNIMVDFSDCIGVVISLDLSWCWHFCL